MTIVDGLRPDYITSEIMPNLSEIGQNGTVGLNFRAVIPIHTPGIMAAKIRNVRKRSDPEWTSLFAVIECCVDIKP